MRVAPEHGVVLGELGVLDGEVGEGASLHHAGQPETVLAVPRTLTAH